MYCLQLNRPQFQKKIKVQKRQTTGNYNARDLWVNIIGVYNHDDHVRNIAITNISQVLTTKTNRLLLFFIY